MADIRQAGVLDDFNRPAEEFPIKYPWLVLGHTDVTPNIHPIGTLQSAAGFIGISRAYYAPLAFGPGDVEVWGMGSGTTGIGEGWRLGMTTIGHQTPYRVQGYEVLVTEGPSANPLNWLLRRLDPDTPLGYVDLASSNVGGIAGTFQLLRTKGDYVEAWWSLDFGATWQLIFQVVDAYFRGPFYLHCGGTGNQTGWSVIGGGVPNLTQYYRWHPGFPA